MALNHTVVKPKVIAETAAQLVEAELTVANLFQKEGIESYVGKENDTVNVKVEGVLPYHDGTFRSGEDGTPREAIVFDRYQEFTIPVAFEGKVYQAVEITDEQRDFDALGWAKFLNPQAKAVARGIQHKCLNRLVNQPYAVTIGNAEGNLRGAVAEARRVLNKFMVKGPRYLVVGSDFEFALLDNEKLLETGFVSEQRAESALADALIGRLRGFNVIVDQDIPADTAYAFVGDAFVLTTAAISVPESQRGRGDVASYDGIAVRHLIDYDMNHTTDRSLVDCYVGTREVKDMLVGWDEVNKTQVIATQPHFVRGIKLTLDGASNYPEAASELATITGVSDAKVWVPGSTGGSTFVPETDPTNV